MCGGGCGIHIGSAEVARSFIPWFVYWPTGLQARASGIVE
jgi:hypothetical protein